jgi:hypothetical protein
MGHNVYINIVLSTEMEDFPLHEHGIPAQLRKQVRDIVAKDNGFKIRRFKMDIIDYETEEELIDEYEEFDEG